MNHKLEFARYVGEVMDHFRHCTNSEVLQGLNLRLESFETLEAQDLVGPQVDYIFPLIETRTHGMTPTLFCGQVLK